MAVHSNQPSYIQDFAPFPRAQPNQKAVLPLPSLESNNTEMRHLFEEASKVSECMQTGTFLLLHRA